MSRNEPWSEKWERLNELGKGGQGVTFRAKSKADGAQIGVLKLLKNTSSPQARRRMSREVLHLTMVHQAGGRVPRVLDHNATPEIVADSQTPLFLAMELVEGETLRQLLDRRTSLPLSEAIAVSLDICYTIRIAHRESVLHRDLKPENVVARVDDSGASAFILDYGLSFNDNSDEGEDLTRMDEGFGNKFLVLPEHSFGQEQRDRRSDLTAVAALFFYCATGEVPGLLRDAKGRMPHQRRGEPANWATALSAATQHQLQTFFAKAFAHELDLRFQNVEELSSRLSELSKRGSTSAPENPIEVAARAKELLHRLSRPTIVGRFRASAQPIMLEVNALVSSMQQDLQKQEVSMHQVGVGEFKLPTGVDEILAVNMVQLQLHHHPNIRGIQVKVGVSGDECIVYGVFCEGNQRVPTKLVRVEEMLRYSANDNPPLPLIRQEICTQMARLIDELARLALDGQVAT